ncbi:nuclear protein 1b [Lepisosteus oculatus]|uniref:nuclear protein 1b n=1 Tax=Lepisosteus oculatus TaxID=7918 RepID=UPI0035F5170F
MACFVEVKKLQPTQFEGEYYDKYEFYNLTDRYCVSSSRKGRSKRESSCNTNRPSPAGHERKLSTKLQNSLRHSRE